MKLKKIILLVAAAVTFSGTVLTGVPNITENVETLAKEKVVKIKMKFNQYSTDSRALKANTKYVYSLNMKKKMKIDVGIYYTQNVKTEMRLFNDQSKKWEVRLKGVKELRKKYYKGNLGTVVVKSADGKKVYLKKTLKSYDAYSNTVNLPKGDYKIEFKMNKNVSKTLMKKVDLTLNIYKHGIVN